LCLQGDRTVTALLGWSRRQTAEDPRQNEAGQEPGRGGLSHGQSFAKTLTISHAR